MDLITLIMALLETVMLGAILRTLHQTSSALSELKEETARRFMNESEDHGESSYTFIEILDIEKALKRLIEELKEGNYIRQDFRFDTKEERFARVEKLIDDFLKRTEDDAK